MIVTKAVALVDTIETEDPNGAFEVILSAATLDRDGEVVDKGAFDPLPDHIPFDIDHGMTVVTTVGSGVPYYADDGTLRVKGTFASTPLAQEVRTLVSEGHVRTTSVTFMSAERVKDSKGVPHVQSAELLNGTFTPVPSNRESVVLAAKSVDVLDQAREDRLVTKLADAVSARLEGAEKSAVPEVAKSIIGSLEAQRDRVQDALEDTYPGRYAYIRGVLPETVVFDVWGDMDCESYQQTYTDDGSVVTLTGLPVEVDVMEIVTPDADADTEPDAMKSADVTAEPAAVMAADSAVKSADVEATEAALLSINENAARLAFGG